MGLNITDLGGIDATQALETTAGSCDEGSHRELQFTDADGGFGCLVGRGADVVATGEGVLAVLTGASFSDDVDVEQLLQALATDARAGDHRRVLTNPDLTRPVSSFLSRR